MTEWVEYEARHVKHRIRGALKEDSGDSNLLAETDDHTSDDCTKNSKENHEGHADVHVPLIFVMCGELGLGVDSILEDCILVIEREAAEACSSNSPEQPNPDHAGSTVLHEEKV